MKKTDRAPVQETISCTPFAGSKKIYIAGSLHKNIKVAMREITLSPTKLSSGKKEENTPVTVYDTSGAYTELDRLKRGLVKYEYVMDKLHCL